MRDGGYASAGMSRSGGNAIRCPRGEAAHRIRPKSFALGASIPAEAYPPSRPLRPQHRWLTPPLHFRVVDQRRAQGSPHAEVDRPTKEEGKDALQEQVTNYQGAERRVKP